MKVIEPGRRSPKLWSKELRCKHYTQGCDALLLVETADLFRFYDKPTFLCPCCGTFATTDEYPYDYVELPAYEIWKAGQS